MTTMTNKIYILLATLLMASCSDFLEPKSQSEYTPKEVSSLNEMLLGNAYCSASDQNDLLEKVSLLDDDIMISNVNAEVSGTDATYYEINVAWFTWQPDACAIMGNLGTGMAVWKTYYKYIMGANAALDYVDQVEGTDNDKNNVRAQAHALRAYYYFQLVNYFGLPYNYNPDALGVPLKLTSALSSDERPRNTVGEVYQQVLSDLLAAEQAYKSLPESMQFKSDGRTSLPMVQLLLSRVYLYMEDWAKAAEYAQKVVENKSFSLAPLASFESSRKMSVYNFATYDCPETIWVFGNVSGYWAYDLNVKLKKVTVDQYWGDSYTTQYSLLNASTELMNLFGDNDLRKSKCLVEEKVYDYSSYQVVSSGGYLPFAKFSISESSKGIPQVVTTKNQGYFAHSFRLAEAYLNLAEADAMRTDKDASADALKALNTLRDSRIEGNDPLTGLSGEALVTAIREERRRELCFEGQRWFDLRRYGMPALTHDLKVFDSEGNKTVTRFTLQHNDPFYALPIPDYAIERNRSLVQNDEPASRQGQTVIVNP